MTQIFRRMDNDEIVELDLSLAEISERVVAGRITLDDGTEAVRDVAAELARDYGVRQRQASRNLGAWPMTSNALGCHPEQVDSYRDFIRSQGLTGVDVLANGSVRISDRRARRELLRACGMRDNDGGYRETYHR